MDVKYSSFLQTILDASEQMRLQLEHQYLSCEQFLLTLFLCVQEQAYEDVNDKDYQEVQSVIANNFSDLSLAIDALQDKVTAGDVTAEDSHLWFNAMHNTTAVVQQVNASEISAGILLQVILAEPPACIRGFLNSTKEADLRKAADMFVQDVSKLQEAEDFVNFVEEVKNVAPALKSAGTEKLLTHQAFLFAIDEDQMATMTYLHMLNDLYKELELVDFPNPPGIIAIPSDVAMDGTVPGVANFSLDKIDRMMICLDISAWFGRMDTTEFECLLLKLYERQDDFIFVFRVPYIEDAVLRQMAAQIENVFALRILRFPSWSLSYMSSLAENYMAQFGFSADADAMKAFRIQLTEEKADGSFYGYATIRKVCEEMMYLKMKNIAAEAAEFLPKTIVENSDATQSSDANNTNTENKSAFHISLADIPLMAHGQLSSVSAKDKLHALIGRAKVKKQVAEIMKALQNSEYTGPYHMFFEGEPGTARTTIAKIFTDFLREEGILSEGIFFEHPLADLTGCCEGETTPLALSLIRDAVGSVLLIDELTAPPKLYPDDEEDPDEEEDFTEDFRTDALNTLISQMQCHRNDLVLIFAGTAKELSLLKESYPELSELVPYTIRFASYETDDLTNIFMDMLHQKGYTAEATLSETVRHYFASLPESVIRDGSFTNARYISNLFDQTISKTEVRRQIEQGSTAEILSADFMLAARDSRVEFNRKRKHPRIGFALPTL